MATTTRPPTVRESRGFACERFATMAFSHEPAWRHRSRKSRRKELHGVLPLHFDSPAGLADEPPDSRMASHTLLRS